MALILEKQTARLESLEETILYRLIDRAQYNVNPDVYVPGKHHFLKYPDKSLVEIRMQYQQEMESVFGRYSVPEERPFPGELPEAQREFPYSFPELNIYDFDKVNLTKEIWDDYIDLVPKFCEAGDDGHHGSAVTYDVLAMMAISERVHFGAFYVAEAKYQAEPEKYLDLIEQRDEEGLMEALTRTDVEERILERIKKKVDLIQDSANTEVRRLIDPEVVVGFYRSNIIPLTKRGQVKYFLNRG